jgi:hypothetical protein
MLQMRVVSFIFSLILLCGASVPGVPARGTGISLQPQDERGGRIRPPDSLMCPRDDLTSFTGRVLSYTRTSQRLSIRVRTDEQTTERFTLRYNGKQSPALWFLLRAEPFKIEDWKLIEARQGRLRPGMRATVWVCNNGAQPVIDWQPPER